MRDPRASPATSRLVESTRTATPRPERVQLFAPFELTLLGLDHGIDLGPRERAPCFGAIAKDLRGHVCVSRMASQGEQRSFLRWSFEQ